MDAMPSMNVDEVEAPEDELDMEANERIDDSAVKLTREWIEKELMRNMGHQRELTQRFIEGTLMAAREDIPSDEAAGLPDFNEQLATILAVVEKSQASDLCYAIKRQRDWCDQQQAERRASIKRQLERFTGGIDAEERLEKTIAALERFRVQSHYFAAMLIVAERNYREVTGNDWFPAGGKADPADLAKTASSRLAQRIAA